MDKLQNIIWQSKFERKTNWLKALKTLESALPIYPGEQALLEEIAVVYTSKKLYKKAIDYYQKSIELNPDSDSLFFRIANCYLSLNELNIGLYYYDKIVDPFPEAMYNKAITLAKLGKIDKTVALLDSLIEMQPDSELPYFFLIEQHLSRKEYDIAIMHMDMTEKKFGKRGKLHFLRGVAYSYLKQWLTAYIEFQKADKLKYKSANSQRAYGIAASRIGKYDQAVTLLLSSIMLEPFNVSTYLDLINIYLTRNQLLEAYNVMENAKQAGPFSTSLSLLRSKILQLIKEKYGSTDHVKKPPE
ncbi:MAG: tetratricopeptide repeat protein [Candidatus Cloacimonetes bacterium]|nr:tetratricopeptide repeat protein [Candidatus Cloacimonadota bacterium]